MIDMPTGESLAIATRIAAMEAHAARNAWADVHASLDTQLSVVGQNVELSAYYAEALMRLGRPREAFDWLERRLDGFAGSANTRASLRAVNLAGAAAFELGRIAEAQALFHTALERATQFGDHLTVGRALNNLALVASSHGDWSAAMNYYTLAMPAYERTASVRGLAECSHNIAATLLEAGDLERAEEWERRAMDLALETGNERLRGFTLGGRAEVMLRKGDFALSIAFGRQAIAAFRAVRDVSSEAHALRLIGQAQHAQGELDSALESLSIGITLASESAVVRVLAECELARARLYAQLDRPDLARADLVEALRHFTALGSEAKEREAARLLATLPESPPHRS